MGRLLLPLLAAFLSLALLLPEAQAKATPAYIALGDSLAAGVGASDPPSRGYVGLTLDALRRSERYRERGLELFNLSVPGATSSDLLIAGGQLETALQEIGRRPVDAAAGDDKVEIISIDIDGFGSYGASVVAAASGQVVLTTWDDWGLGYYVVIQHDDGSQTLYAHLSDIYVVQGQYVEQGEAIGALGCTGYCTGTHLHFEVLDQGVRRDPLDYLP